MVTCLRDAWDLRSVDIERFCAAAGADTARTMQGNLLNVVKSAPQKAIDFYAFDLFKVLPKSLHAASVAVSPSSSSALACRMLWLAHAFGC